MVNKSSSSKKTSDAEEKPAVEQAKPAPKPGKIGTEIDEIFGGKKRKKPEPEKTEKKQGKGMKQSSEENRMKENKKRKKRGGEKPGGFSDPPTRSRKRTEEGLAIYTEEELGVNKANAGGTSLCPFDCDCCF